MQPLALPETASFITALLREKHSVVVVPHLGKVAHGRGCRIGDKLKPIHSCARRRSCGHFDGAGILQEQSRETDYGIAELHTPCHPAPFQMERIDGCRQPSQWMCRIEAIGNCEGIEHV